MNTDYRELTKVTEEIARNAGKILMKYYQNLESVEKKSLLDIVTIADKESEKFIVEEIKSRFPDHGILAEEGGAYTDTDTEYLWVIDPLDGTVNFTHGLRIFAVSIGILHKGRPVSGCVHLPALEECYTATEKEGAFLNGMSIQVSSSDKLVDSLVVTGFPANRVEMLDDIMPMVENVLRNARGLLRFGAAAVDLAWLASGKIEAFYELGLNPWDMAAGWLLVNEAGGQVTGLGRDKPFDLFQKEILASNSSIHEELIECLLKRER